MLKTLIVDDHPIVRHGLRLLLGGVVGIDVTAEAESGTQALAIIESLDLDLVILDIKMDERNGLDVLDNIITFHPSLRVIVYSMYPEEEYAIRCFKEGASAYISKKESPEELLEAIRCISLGNKYISPPIAEQMTYLLQDRQPLKPHDKLSSKEFRILLKIGSGMSLAMIAEEMFLSPKSVSTYKTRILKKLGMNNTASLIRYVLEENLS